MIFIIGSIIIGTKLINAMKALSARTQTGKHTLLNTTVLIVVLTIVLLCGTVVSGKRKKFIINLYLFLFILFSYIYKKFSLKKYSKNK